MSIGDGAASRESDAAAAKGGVPSWIGVGKKLHWWSDSQKKNMSVRVSKVDDKKGLVFVIFDIDQKVWKSVPFSKIGRKDCPLRNPKDDSAEASKKDDSGASKNGSQKEKKRKDPKDGSVTPDWRENMKAVNEQKARREQQGIDLQKKEEGKMKEERKRQELVAAERRKVEQAFEKRKEEAEKQRLKEEEEWRQNLIKKRELQAAEDEIKDAEKEARRKIRREEKEKERLLNPKPPKKAKIEAAAVGVPMVIPPRANVPDLAALQGIPMPPAAQMAQPWFMAGAGQLPAGAAHMPAAMHAMQMMAAAQAQAQQGGSTWGQGDLSSVAGNSGGSSGFGGAGMTGAWGSFGNAGADGHMPPGMLPGVGAAQMLPGMGFGAAQNAGAIAGQGAAQWGGQWGNMPHGQFQAPWGNG